MNRRARAVVETLLPGGAHPVLGAGALEAGFEAFVEELREAPAPLRRALQAGLFAAAWIAPVLIGRPPPITLYGRETRERALEAMAASRRYPLRQLFSVVKRVVALRYGGDRGVRAAIGYRSAVVDPSPSGARGAAAGGTRPSIGEAFDYLVVGSGAAGATAARVLAGSGASVAVLEEGPAVATGEFGEMGWPALRGLYRDAGAQLARGRSYLPVLQGRCLGGSTVVNSAIMWRLPEPVLAEWHRDHGLGDALPVPELHRCFDRIERDLSVAPTPAGVWGGNNEAMDRAGRELGIAAAPTRRAVHDCRGSARCQLGCPFGAKQSMLVTYLPQAERDGARLLTGARVDRVLMEGERAVGVEGEGFRLGARRGVVVAASAVQTPGILRRSGVRSPHLGRHFQAHPGASVLGVFDREIGMWSGATQGFEADEQRVDGRFKIETVALVPELVLAALPGVGPRWLQGMAEAPRIAVWAIDLRAHAEGSVLERRGRTVIRFEPDRRDVANLRAAFAFTAEMLFAAGAREVVTGIHGLPERIGPGSAPVSFASGPDDPRAYPLVLTHLFGTARMSPDPRAGVVGPDFAVHGTRNLFVVDSSVFPSNIGVNPQLSIMGLAMLAAERIGGRR